MLEQHSSKRMLQKWKAKRDSSFTIRYLSSQIVAAIVSSLGLFVEVLIRRDVETVDFLKFTMM